MLVLVMVWFDWVGFFSILQPISIYSLTQRMCRMDESSDCKFEELNKTQFTIYFICILYILYMVNEKISLIKSPFMGEEEKNLNFFQRYIYA